MALCASIQWRRQLMGTWARTPPPPPGVREKIFLARYYAKLFNSALFVQPYSLWNDTIAGYNGVCVKVNVVNVVLPRNAIH